MHKSCFLLRSKPTITMTTATLEGTTSRAHSRLGMDNFVQDGFYAMRLVVMGLFVLGGFRLGPGAYISHTSPSRGVKFSLGVGMFDVRLRLIPHFALGPIANVSNPATPGGDPVVLGMNDMDGWFDVRGPDVSDVGVTSSSCRVVVRVGVSNFRNRFDAVRGQDSVSTPPSFQALPVLRATRGR